MTLIAVAAVLAIGALSSLLNRFAGYRPASVGGFPVLLVGTRVAERVAESITGTDESRLIHAASLAITLLNERFTTTIVLATIGFEISALTSLFTAFVALFSVRTAR